jgi:hypothetical protein
VERPERRLVQLNRRLDAIDCCREFSWMAASLRSFYEHSFLSFRVRGTRAWQSMHETAWDDNITVIGSAVGSMDCRSRRASFAMTKRGVHCVFHASARLGWVSRHDK